MASGMRWDLQSGEADSGTSTLPRPTLPPGVDTSVLPLGLCRCVEFKFLLMNNEYVYCKLMCDNVTDFDAAFIMAMQSNFRKTSRIPSRGS